MMIHAQKKWLFKSGMLARFSVIACTATCCVMAAAAGTRSDIRDFGAAVDAKPAVNAAAIQRAIDGAEKAGGGTVVVPAGTFTSGTIWLKRNVELHLAEGSVLKASGDLADYNRADAYPENWGCPPEYWNGCHFIIARQADGASITGEGTIYGNGDAFYDDEPRAYYSWMKPGASCWWNGIRWAKDKKNLRPGQLIVFVKCRNVAVRGITIRNSPCWSLWFWGCERVRVSDYTVRNGENDGNSDGIDFDCSRDVVLERADIDTGDDAIAIRASARAFSPDGKGRLGAPALTEGVRIRDCRLRSTSSVFRIGVGEGTIRDVSVENVTCDRGGTAVNISTRYGEPKRAGTDVERVVFRNCHFTNCRAGAVVRSNGGDHLEFGIRDIRFEDCSFGGLKPSVGSDRGVRYPVDPKQVVFVRVPEAELPLEQGFLDPPKSNRPQVWWWFDAMAPDAAITRDLEGLKRVGVSGFHIYGGSVTGKGWLPRVKWALHEANRLGLDGVVMIGAAGCGHAQTDPRHAQKDLVFSEARMNVCGAPRAAVTLPRKGVKETPKNADGSPKYYWDIAVLAVPDTTNDVPLAEVRDVSRYLNRETGAFEWPDAPEGKWRILRVGYVPKVFGWMGCYIDHTSKAAFDAHWARVMTPLLEALAPDERSALKGVMCDSWEAGTVSWTDTFAEEFRRRRGYDILPWLPVKAGVRLVSGPKRARFLRDFNETVSELIAENHYAYQKEVANRHGLISIAEAAGPHQRQGDVRRMQGRCDVAMGEFWMPSGHRPLPPQRFMVRDAANAAHVYGMDEVLAEAFTTINTYWIESPATMKPCADRAFCDGLTRVCYHGMKLSPSLTDKPGFIRNVGTHYNPQTTWFDQSGAFNLYLSRCSWMLSRGRFAADCLLYAGDAVNLFAGLKTPANGLGEGFDYDFCPTELLLQARVEDGQVVLPSGMRYRVLMLSDRNPKTNGHMRPGPMKAVKEYPPVGLSVGEAAMLKLRELVEAGATLVGPRPSGPTSMNESSARYHAAADALWGPRGQTPNVRGQTPVDVWGQTPVDVRGQTPVGKGRVFVDRAAARAFLAENGVGPDFSTRGLSPSPDALSPTIDWIHRILPDGTDIYFISNQKGKKISFGAIFRQPKERSVELWDAVTGQRTPMGTVPEIVPETPKGTVPEIVGTVPGFVGTGPCMALELPAYGSIFVVFRSQQAATLPQGTQRARRPLSQCNGQDARCPSAAAKMAAPHTGRTGVSPVQTLPGPWSVTFDPAWGGPKEPVVFPALTDWTARPEPGIRHYSGTAVYRTTFDAPLGWKPGEPLQIDLGTVHEVADVLVNGKLAGTAWTAPYAVTASNIKEKGNALEVRVTNLWPNRLIYDAGLPEAERLTHTNINPYKPGDPLLSSGLLGPVQIMSTVLH